MPKKSMQMNAGHAHGALSQSQRRREAEDALVQHVLEALDGPLTGPLTRKDGEDMLQRVKARTRRYREQAT